MKYLGLIELVLVFGIVLGLIWYEMRSVQRAKEKREQKTGAQTHVHSSIDRDAENPPRKG